jgi:hypothetical protein
MEIINSLIGRTRTGGHTQLTRECYPYITADGYIAFHQIKPQPPVMRFDEVMMWNMNNWGCYFAPERQSQFDSGKKIIFFTDGGIPTKVISRLAVLVQRKLKMYSYFRHTDEHFLTEVNPFSRLQKISEIDNEDVPADIAGRIYDLDEDLRYEDNENGDDDGDAEEDVEEDE